MVSEARLALNRMDRLLAVYVAIVTVVILARGHLLATDTLSLLIFHALIAILLVLFARLGPAPTGIGGVLHDLYPLLLLGPLYSEVGILNQRIGLEHILRHDAVIQHWEALVFGGQISYEWIRRYPSVFWSGLLHLAYIGYYPLVILGPVILEARGDRSGARYVLFRIMTAYALCFVVFVLYPVAGPNFAFPHPTGPVREVWSARLVYHLLAAGSSVGAAFPSSHVAATVAAVTSLFAAWRPLALVFLVPCLLLIVAVVYCQMHYGMDAGTGLLLGLAIGGLAFGRGLKPARSTS